METALEQVILTCQARVRAYIAGMGVALDTVDDIAQEVFISYHRSRKNRPLEVEVLPWLKGIARNLVYNHFRGESRRSRHHQAAAAVFERTASFDEHAAVRGDLTTALRHCMEGMPDKSRTMVGLRYNEGLDSQAIADRIESTAEAVRMALMRVRAALKDCIEGRLGGEVSL